MLTHDHFEQLCAAAVTGQISRDELVTLHEHMETCANCRDFVGDVGHVVGPAVAECAHKHSPAKAPKGATERFIAKAHSEGIPLGKLAPNGTWPRRQRAVVLIAVAAFIALTCLSLYPKFLAEEWRPLSWTSRLTPPPSIQNANNEADDLRRENAELKNLIAVSASKVAGGQQQIKVAESRISEIRSRLNAVETDGSLWQKRVEDRDALLARVQQDRDRQAAVKQADDIAIQTEESELRTLRERVLELDARLHESEQLSATAKQASDLIVARNLHIIDVHDADEDGQRKRAFGRIFYTEGKSLVFYAYDLADPNGPNLKTNFHVWGENDGASRPAKSLGIFKADDETEGRWILTVDDPHVLAQINTLFVTIETRKKAVTQPNGKKILYAFLGNKANHP